MSSSHRRRLASQGDAGGIHAIYAPVVRDTVTSFEYEVPTVEEMARRIREGMEQYPWLVAVDPEDEQKVLGYAYACAWRARTAYQWSCEVSVYVHAEHHRKGIATALYTDLLARLKKQGYVLVVAGATLPNDPSVAFHKAFGFEAVGVFPGCGFKAGGWHDVGFWKLELGERCASPTPPTSFLP
ncbi:MAG: GNAT family N-acetyltransferase [Planctomycetota bacterium]